MRKLLILSGTGHYGRYATADTVNTAVTPDILNLGAIGIYGQTVSDSDTAGNNNKSNLIVAAATGAGISAVPAFVAGGGDLVRFMVGGTNGYTVASGAFNIRGIKSIKKQIYVAGVKQVTYIGFNTVTGSLNLPTIVQNSEAGLLAVQIEASTDDQIREQEDYTQTLLTASQAPYSILASVANNINNALLKTQTAEIVGNGTKATVAIGGSITGTGAAATQTSTAVNGSNVVTITATTLTATTIAVGDLIELGGIIYKVALVDITANVLTLTLDRNYVGTSYAAVRLDNGTNGVKGFSVAPTEYGLKITVDTIGANYGYAANQVLAYATMTYSVGGSAGLGTGALVTKIEQNEIAYRGDFDTIDARMKHVPRYADLTVNYVTYVIEVENHTTDSGANNNKQELSTIMICVPTGTAPVAELDTLFAAIKTALPAVINI